MRKTGQDKAHHLEQYETDSRSFWVISEGDSDSTRLGLSALLAEHQWMSDTNPEQGVQQGDIVLDCGAHIGTFTCQALRRGAAKVIAIEPAPDTLCCLKRNLASEIAAGQVVVVEKGVWSSIGSLDLRVSNRTSAEDSFVEPVPGYSVRVPVTTIDQIVQELQLPRVDYIKFDVEGAERQALAGGLSTLRRFQPRIMLAMYHRADDRIVLPNIIHSANSGYRSVCGPCELDPNNPRAVIPHVLYFR